MQYMNPAAYSGFGDDDQVRMQYTLSVTHM